MVYNEADHSTATATLPDCSSVDSNIRETRVNVICKGGNKHSATYPFTSDSHPGGGTIPAWGGWMSFTQPNAFLCSSATDVNYIFYTLCSCS